MFWNFIKNNFDKFLNLIYNQKCSICSCAKVDNLLCKNCLKDVEYLNTFTQRVYKNIPIYCATNYTKTTKKLIQMFKFSHKKKAAIVLGEILFNYFQKLNLNDDFIIIYPPTNYIKSATRGYNHMFLIAREFSKHTNFEIKKDLIKKIKSTKPQYKAKDRHKNIKGSFAINKKYVGQFKNKNILLIDDITTSGATLEEIINCLLENKIKNMTCLVIARAGC